MQGSERVTPPKAVPFEPSLSARVTRAPLDLASRIADNSETSRPSCTASKSRANASLVP